MSANRDDRVTVPALHAMKREGRKIVGVVAWDYQIARIVDRAGVDIVSVGDTVGVNLWGHSNPLEVTMEQMIVVCRAVRRGVRARARSNSCSASAGRSSSSSSSPATSRGGLIMAGGPN